MMQRDLTVMAVHLRLERDGEYLLSLRQGTKWMNGHFSFIAGHVEAGESAKNAMCREAKEEANLTLESQSLTLVHTMHRLAGHERLDLFFTTSHASWSELKNNEPERCGLLGWFALEALQAPLVPYIAAAISAYQAGQPYSE